MSVARCSTHWRVADEVALYLQNGERRGREFLDAFTSDLQARVAEAPPAIQMLAAELAKGGDVG